MTSLQNRTFPQTPLKIPFTISTERFHVIKSDQRGHNRILFPLPYSWHRNIRHKQLTDPIEFEEIILSDQDLKSTWLGPSTSSQLSTTPLKTGSSQNEMTYFDSFRNPIPPVQRPPPLPPALDSKQCAEVEAVNRRLIYNTFKLRVRNVFGYPRPPLISMLNASVGHHKNRNFSKEILHESNRLYMRENYDEVLLPHTFIETSSKLLTDWQIDFHCFMHGSPVPSLILKAKKGCKKSKNCPMVDAPTYDEIWQNFIEQYRLHIADNWNKFPMFTAHSVK
ncbi:hypothetical protein C1645_810171 [Glomus cerebriforme]|uniref:Uncharacterized protein n=1 Tax=Glomus cerebriforme TaxID=658196 RepID=A0A397SFF2_9GLOM|nr:hypothetical protein C1645_810171 [Glomus cerebriforme]